MNHFPERLKNARKMKGYSLQDLSERLETTITKQDLNRLESGVKLPDSGVISRLCKVLDVTHEYFTRTSSVTLENIEFRKLKKLPVKTQERVKHQTVEFLERYMELEELLSLDNNLPFKIRSYPVNIESDVDSAANVMREHLQLGKDPIYNIYGALEENSIKIYKVDVEPSFSGMSTVISDKVAVIVFNDNKELPLVRKRFTLLHELAHLFLDLSKFEEDEKKVEKLCDRFAGAMLLPEKTLLEYFGGKRDKVYANELKAIRSSNGISLPAIMYRAFYLNLISSHHFKYFMVRYNQFYKKEEIEGKGYEGREGTDRFIQLLLRGVAQEIISTTKAASLNNQTLGDFREQHLDATT